MEDAVSERSAEPLLPSGVKVPFEEIDSALNRNSDDEARRAAGRALTGTIVVAGPPRRLTEAANALTELPDVGLRAVLISYGDNPAPTDGRHAVTNTPGYRGYPLGSPLGVGRFRRGMALR